MSEWRIDTMAGGSGTMSHPFMAKDPACPDGRHPTRWCGCKPFRTMATAREYIAEQESK